MTIRYTLRLMTAALSIALLLPVSTAQAEAQKSNKCRQPWTLGLRRPERFTLVKDCVTVSGIVKEVKTEPDGDLHIQLQLLDHHELLNKQNLRKQKGALVVELEPWQRGLSSNAAGVLHLAQASFCPSACTFKVGERIRVTSAIVTDREHGWNEAHSPSFIKVLKQTRVHQ